MLTINIIKVLRGPQNEKPFEGEYGLLYKQAWLCEVETDGINEQAKITMGSKKPEGSPSAKYIRDGSMIASKKRTEHKGQAGFYVDIDATKELHGEGWKSGHKAAQKQSSSKLQQTPNSNVKTTYEDNRNRSFAAAYGKDIICAWEKPDTKLTEVLEHWQRIADFIWTWLEAPSVNDIGKESGESISPVEEPEEFPQPEIEMEPDSEVELDSLVALLKKEGVYTDIVRKSYTKHELIKEFLKAGCDKAKFVTAVKNYTDHLPF